MPGIDILFEDVKLVGRLSTLGLRWLWHFGLEVWSSRVGIDFVGMNGSGAGQSSVFEVCLSLDTVELEVPCVVLVGLVAALLVSCKCPGSLDTVVSSLWYVRYIFISARQYLLANMREQQAAEGKNDQVAMFFTQISTASGYDHTLCWTSQMLAR